MNKLYSFAGALVIMFACAYSLRSALVNKSDTSISRLLDSFKSGKFYSFNNKIGA